MRQTRTFPTPYGVSCPVFENPDDKDGYLFNGEGFGLCAGIFDPAERRRLIDDIKAGGGSFSTARLVEYGGFDKLLKVPLSRPTEPAYPQIMRSGAEELGLGRPVEAIVTLVMDRDRWCDRAAALLPVLEQNLGQLNGGDHPITGLAMTLALQIIVTGALEHLAETEIDCLEAAAFYALTTHEQWRKAGLTWLEPVRNTWFRAWVKARPVYRSFAQRCQAEEPALPIWITGA